AQVYLGLGPDDEYEDYDEPDDRDVRDPRDVGTAPGRPTPSAVRPSSAPPAGGRAASPTRTPREGGGRPRPAAPEPASEPATEGSVVRTLPPKDRVPAERRSADRLDPVPPPPRAKAGVRP